MTRDGVVAFPLSDPAVPAGGNPGRQYGGAETSGHGPAADRPAQRSHKFPLNHSVKSFRNNFAQHRGGSKNGRGLAAPGLRTVLAAVEARAPGATVIGGRYLADRTFGT